MINLTFHYPNGTPYSKDNHEPLGSKKQEKKTKKIEFGNRGMDFEMAINQSNSYYLTHNIAVIHKKPTPIQIVNVDYPKRSAAVIKEAYFKQASTTDYNGVYKGFYLDFEAKETKNKTSFPFKNFHQHQIDHMELCTKQNGICFVLLWFSSLNRCFFYDAKKLIDSWNLQEKNGKKSLNLSILEKNGIEIFFGVNPRIPYLSAVDDYLSRIN